MHPRQRVHDTTSENTPRPYATPIVTSSAFVKANIIIWTNY